MSARSTKIAALSCLVGALVFGALQLISVRHIPRAAASVFEALELDDLIDRADLIVEARVAKRNYRSVPRSGAIQLETHIELEVRRVHHGEAGERLSFRLPGGKGGGREQLYLGVPELEPREEILAFFTIERGSPKLLGWVQGVYRITRDASGTASARRDGHGALIDRRGRFTRPDRDAIPLEELRGAISSRLKMRNAQGEDPNEQPKREEREERQDRDDAEEREP